MGNIAINVGGIGKRYRIGAAVERPASARHAAGRLLLSPFNYLRTVVRSATEEETLWALRDVSFDVPEGEAFAIIGANGAGKSTLLKILSRVTEPTVGSVKVYGRLAALLEVGTGFHPDLTGRENVFLNGAILGMRRAEIRRKFDEIVAFSGVERFIDTPVKRYSSGMYVRLAFAVAAHLEPDILVIDEVLSVGDHAFQQRCLGKMREVAGSGRTVVFVSHNLPAVKTLCTRAVLLEHGQLTAEGDVDDVVRKYLRTDEIVDGVIPENLPRVVGTGELRFQRVWLSRLDGRPVQEIFFGQPFRLNLVYTARQAISDAAFEVGISTPEGVRIVTVTSLDRDGAPTQVQPGTWVTSVDIDATLLPHQYAVDLAVHHWRESKVTIDWVERALTFNALDVAETDTDHYVRFSTNYSLNSVRGFVRPVAAWTGPTAIHP